MLAPVAIGLRVFQLLLGIVVLGLAVTLVRAQVFGGAPVTTTYSSFVGGFNVIAALVGMVGLFFDAIPALVTLALDGLAGVFGLAGGIAWAVGLKGISCTSGDPLMIFNDLINLGREGNNFGVAVDPNDNNDSILAHLKANCQKGMADEIIQFILFVVALGLVGVGYVRMRKGGSSSGSYVA